MSFLVSAVTDSMLSEERCPSSEKRGGMLAGAKRLEHVPVDVRESPGSTGRSEKTRAALIRLARRGTFSQREKEEESTLETGAPTALGGG